MKTEFVHVRLTPEEARVVRIAAAAAGLTRSALIRHLLREHVGGLEGRREVVATTGSAS